MTLNAGRAVDARFDAASAAAPDAGRGAPTNSSRTPVGERPCRDGARTPDRASTRRSAPANSRAAQTCSADPDRLMPRAPVGVEITGSPAAMKSNILMLVPDPENIGLTATSAAAR